MLIDPRLLAGARRLLAGARRLHVDVGGSTIALWVAGSGPPTVFLHGYPETSLSWRHVFESIADEVTCYAPDLPGWGDSTTARAPTLTTLIEDIAELVRGLQRGAVTMVGHDWGAAIAYGLALEHPSLVRRIVTVNFSPGRFEVWRGVHFAFFALPLIPEVVMRRWPGAIESVLLRWWAHRAEAFPSAVVGSYLRAARRPSARRTTLSTYRHLVRQSLVGKPPLGMGPTGFGRRAPAVPWDVIWGMRDPIATPRVLAAYGRAIADGKLAIERAERLGISTARRRAQLFSLLELSVHPAAFDRDSDRRRVDDWHRRNLVAEVGGTMRLTPRGALWYNHMQMDVLPLRDLVRALGMFGSLAEQRRASSMPPRPAAGASTRALTDHPRPRHHRSFALCRLSWVSQDCVAHGPRSPRTRVHGLRRRVMRVLVIGGTGFFGSRVVAALRAMKAEVTVAGSRSGADVALDLECVEPMALAAHDVVVNCTDTLAHAPDHLHETALATGVLYLETTADPGPISRALARRNTTSGPGVSVLGMGIFPGLSNLVARSAFVENDRCGPLEVGMQFSPFSAAGAGMVALIAHLMTEPAPYYERGVRRTAVAFSGGPPMPYDGSWRGSLRAAIPETDLLHASTGAPDVLALLSPRPGIIRPFLHLAALLVPRWQPFRRAYLWMIRASVGLLRRVMFRKRPTRVVVSALAGRHGATREGYRVSLATPDGIACGAYAIAATAAMLHANRPAPGTYTLDELVSLDAVLDAIKVIPQAPAIHVSRGPTTDEAGEAA